MKLISALFVDTIPPPESGMVLHRYDRELEVVGDELILRCRELPPEQPLVRLLRDRHWDLGGLPACGREHVMQTLATGEGASATQQYRGSAAAVASQLKASLEAAAVANYVIFDALVEVLQKILSSPQLLPKRGPYPVLREILTHHLVPRTALNMTREELLRHVKRVPEVLGATPLTYLRPVPATQGVEREPIIFGTMQGTPLEDEELEKILEFVKSCWRVDRYQLPSLPDLAELAAHAATCVRSFASRPEVKEESTGFWSHGGYERVGQDAEGGYVLYGADHASLRYSLYYHATPFEAELVDAELMHRIFGCPLEPDHIRIFRVDTRHCVEMEHAAVQTMWVTFDVPRKVMAIIHGYWDD